jgi:hypothetical protein
MSTLTVSTTIKPKKGSSTNEGDGEYMMSGMDRAADYFSNWTTEDSVPSKMKMCKLPEGFKIETE